MSENRFSEKREIKAVFFDLDGTLIDSKRDITASVNEIRKDLGLAALPAEEVLKHVGRGTLTLLKEVLPATVDIAAVYPDFIEYYKKNSLKYSVFYDGAIDLLLGLKGLKKVLITNKAYAVTAEIVKKYQLEKIFDLIYGGDTFELRKPDPFPLNAAAAELKLEKDEIIYFGDSLPDYQASQAANICCVLADYGYGSKSELAACKNALFIPRPAALAQVVENLKTRSWSDLLLNKEI